MMDKEQRIHLTERTQDVLRENPKLKSLLDLLLSHGGKFAILPVIEEDLDKILTRGYIQSGRGAKMSRGEPCHCHSNAAACWDKNRDRSTIVTGYGLSEDGIWRQHTWVVDLKDCVHQRKKLFRIYETTTKRAAYFGYQMTPLECEQFLDDNF